MAPYDLPLVDNGNNKSPITDRTLFKFNAVGCALHSVQGLLMLVASQAVPSIKAFKKPLSISYLDYDKTTEALVPASRPAFDVEIGVAAAVFILLSAVAHGLILLKFDAYIAGINKGINRLRWYEYALSSSVMICSIAVLFGCYDLGSLVLMFAVNAVMNLFGLLMEEMNPPEREAVNWTPFLFGCVAGIAPWIVVFMYFFGSGNYSLIPSFVYGILGCYVVFFNTFPVNMALQYARVGKWKDYRVGEKTYIVLSLASKSLLTYLVFGGTFQPNGNN